MLGSLVSRPGGGELKVELKAVMGDIGGGWNFLVITTGDLLEPLVLVLVG